MLHVNPETSELRQQVIPRLERVKEKHLLASDWQQEGANFIPMRGTWHVNSRQDFGLDEEIKKFLSNDKKVLLLLGDSGAGKSLYTQGLAINLWKAYRDETPIPLWISLPSLKNPTNRAIEETFENYGLTVEQIQYLQHTHSFVFILDAYDEINKVINLFVSNRLLDWRAKVIITCRREYLYSVDNYQQFFMPFQGERPLHSAYAEIIVSLFNEKQVQDYFESYNRNRGAERLDWQLYQQALDEIPGLKKLTTTPFILKLSIEALPRIIQRFKETEPAKQKKLTQAALYDVFMEQWFIRQEKKLKESQQVTQDENIKPEFWRYAKELAEAMHKEAVTQISYEANSSDLFDPVQANPWERFFNPIHPRLSLLRTACLMREVSPNHYAFIHPSLGEYFLTRKLFEDLSNSGSSYEKKDDDVSLSSATTLTQVAGQERSQLNTYFNQSALVKQSSIIQFFADRVDEDERFKQSLFDRVYASRNNPQGGIAAANAITILNRARVSFSGMDLSGINIPGADLSYGIFDGTLFQNANLQGVKLTGAWLCKTNFKNSLMHEVDFEEYPSIYLKNAIDCTYSKDGKYLAVANGCIISLYEVETKKLIRNFKGHMNYLTGGVAFSPDSSRKQIASGSCDGTIRLWDVESGNTVKIFVVPGDSAAVTAIAFSPNGNQLVSGSENGTLNLWEINGLSEAASLMPNPVNNELVAGIMCYINEQSSVIILPQNMAGYRISIPIMSFARSADGRNSLTVDSIAGVASVVFHPNGYQFASGGHDENINIWDIRSGQLVRTFEKFTGGNKQPAHKEGMISLFDIFPNRKNDDDERIVWSIAFSPDGKLLASASGDTTKMDDSSIKLWDVESGYLVRVLQGHSYIPRSVAFSPDGEQLISGSNDHSVKLWDVATGELIKTFSGHLDKVVNVSYSPNDEVASLSIDGTVKFWKVLNNHHALIVDGHNQAVLGCCFSQDGKKIASGSYDKTIKIWDRESGKLLKTLKGHSLGITSVAFSPDCKKLVSGGVDHQIMLWDADSGSCLMVFDEEPGDSVQSVTFSPDGDQVVAGIANGKSIIWSFKAKKHLILENKESAEFLNNMVNAITFLPKGSKGLQLISADQFTGIMLWDVYTGQLLKVFEQFKHVWKVTLSPSKKLFVIGKEGGDIISCSVDFGCVIKTFKGHAKGITSIVFISDNQFVSGSLDGTLRFWDIPSGDCLNIEELKTPIRSVDVLSISSAVFLVTGCRDNSMSYWRIKNSSETKIELILVWSNRRETLLATNMKLDDITGLSNNNLVLLKQKSAIIPHHESKEHEETKNDESTLSAEEETEVFLERMLEQQLFHQLQHNAKDVPQKESTPLLFARSNIKDRLLYDEQHSDRLEFEQPKEKPCCCVVS